MYGCSRLSTPTSMDTGMTDDDDDDNDNDDDDDNDDDNDDDHDALFVRPSLLAATAGSVYAGKTGRRGPERPGEEEEREF